MNDLVEMPERVPALSPIVTPLPFYRQPLACRQLAVAALVVLALIGGALRWHQLLMSVSDARQPRPRAALQVEPVRLDLLLVEPVRVEPVRLDPLLIEPVRIEPAQDAGTGPCL